MADYQVVHVGINAKTPEEAKQSAALLGSLFNISVREAPTAEFVDGIAEFTAFPDHGAYGHIGIGVKDIEAEMERLEKLGVEFDPKSIKRNEEGRISFVYLQTEILGFGIHLSKIG